MSFERTEPFWTHVSSSKRQRSLEMGTFGTHSAAKGVQGKCRGRGDKGRVWEDPGGMSLERAKRARKGFEGGTSGEVAGIVLGVPHHASLFSP